MKPAMSFLRRSATVVAACLSVSSGMLVTPAAQAQVKAALVKDTEAAGRVPYEYYIQFTRFGCSINCSNYVNALGSILFDAPPVPAGKRLVLQWVSAVLPANDTRAAIALQASRVLSFQDLKWSYFGPFYASYVGNAAMSSGIFATYGPGETPHLNISIQNISNYDGSVTLAGYLIDATN